MYYLGEQFWKCISKKTKKNIRNVRFRKKHLKRFEKKKKITKHLEKKRKRKK